MAKETRLDDSAEIYQPRTKQTEKQKLSEMTFQDKITYFNQYYRTKFFVFLAVIGFLIYLIYTITSPKIETIFYAAIVNNYLDEEKKSEFYHDFGEYLDIDSKKQGITLDTTYVLGKNDIISSDSVSSSQQKISTYTYAQKLDVIIAPAEVFQSLAYYGYFDDLADQLPTDLYAQFAESLYLTNQEDDPEEKAYGIYLTDSEVFDSLGNVIEDPVLGIITNSKYKENSIEFLRYVFELY